MRTTLPERVRPLLIEDDVPLEILTVGDPRDNVPDEQLVVTGVARNEQDEVLFVKSTKEGRDWEFPSGHVEDGEHPTDAIHREFTEETGFETTASVPEVVLVWTFPDSVITQVIYRVNIGDRVSDPVEEIEDVRWCDELPDSLSFSDPGSDLVKQLFKGDVEEAARTEMLVAKMKDAERSHAIAAGAVGGGLVLLGVAKKLFGRTREEIVEDDHD